MDSVNQWLQENPCDVNYKETFGVCIKRTQRNNFGNRRLTEVSAVEEKREEAPPSKAALGLHPESAGPG